TIRRFPSGKGCFWTRPPAFRLIVKWDVDVKPLREFINALDAGTNGSAYLRYYYSAVRKAQIISLEEVEHKLLDQGDERYRRIEDLPFPDDIVSPHQKKLTLMELVRQSQRRKKGLFLRQS